MPHDGQGQLPTQPRLGTETVRARRTDPRESHQAAASVGDLTDKQGAVLGLVARIGPCDDRKLVAEYQLRSGADRQLYPEQTDSGIRTRRHELAERNLLVKVGTTRLESGRQAALWEIVFDQWRNV